MAATPSQAAPGFADRPPVELPHPVRMRVLGAVMIGVFLAALDQTVVGTALPADHHRPRRQRPLHVGVHRLPADLDDQRPALRQAVRPVRPATDLPVRHRRVHGRLAAGRPVAGDVAARRRSRRPGPRRGRAVPDRARGHRRTCSRRRSAAATRACSGPCSASPSSSARPSAGSSPTRSAGRSCSSSTCRSARSCSASVWRYLPSYHLGGERPKIDYLGAALFTGALVPILVGLTNKRTADWTDPLVGGLIVLGAVDPGCCSCGSSRAPTSRSCRSACSATARSRSRWRRCSWRRSGSSRPSLFLPRWFQVVAGSSATESGLPDAAAARRR